MLLDRTTSTISYTHDEYTYTNDQNCKTCEKTFYVNRYYNVPKYCSTVCFWYSDEPHLIKKCK